MADCTPSWRSCIFSDIIVSTDSEKISEIANYYGAEIPFLRPKEYAHDKSPDIEWIYYTLDRLKKEGRSWNCFSILRPTNPFRQSHTIQKAYQVFEANKEAHSLRAVEKCGQHPYKMWEIKSNRLNPLFKAGGDDVPYHSRPYQSLPELYIQNASLEMAKTSSVMEMRSISGDIIVPFVSEGNEGFDINTEFDWIIAEHLVKKDDTILPSPPKKPWGKVRQSVSSTYKAFMKMKT